MPPVATGLPHVPFKLPHFLRSTGSAYQLLFQSFSGILIMLTDVNHTHQMLYNWDGAASTTGAQPSRL